MKHLEKLLLQLLVFLIPTNLALHWLIDEAYLNGRLVDYFLPKLYLSDIPALILIIFYVFRSLSIIRHKGTFNKFFSSNVGFKRLCLKLIGMLPLLLFPTYLLIRSFIATYSLPSIWYSLKVIEFLLLGAYLLTYPPKALVRTIIPPLLLAMTLQAGVSLYQFINQSSLFGYYFLGEVDLSTSAIVRNPWFGSLEVSPYGTTSHPNVLAGFMGVGTLLYLLSTHLSPMKNENKAAKLFFISLILIVLLLTRSWGAWLALTACLAMFLANQLISKRISLLIFQMLMCSTLVIAPLFISLVYQSGYLGDNPSFRVRYELNRVATTLFQSSPFMGIGPNQFVHYLPQTTIAGQKSLFLQPPHNLFLLFISETGLLGILLLLSLVLWVIHTYSLPILKTNISLAYHLPLFSLMVIGSLDHYPLTLQSGQLLLTLGIALSILGIKQSTPS